MPHSGHNKVKLSIIIPAFNEERYIGQCLNAIGNITLDKDSYEIIVVDNGSTDKTPDIVKGFCNVQYLLLREGNVGAVRNFGAKTANGEILAFIDSDCLIDEAWADRGIHYVTQNESLVCGGPYRTRDNARWIEKYWLLENVTNPKVQQDLLGGCIIIRRKTFENVGGFNEEMTSGEDTDLSRRLTLAGQNVSIKADLAVVHLGNPTTVEEFVKRQVWHSENYLLFLKDSARDPIFWMSLAFSTALALMVSGLLSLSLAPTLIALITIIVLVVVLSIKRILRSNYELTEIYTLAPILAIDFLYLFGRTFGLLKSLKTRLSRISHSPSFRAR